MGLRLDSFKSWLRTLLDDGQVLKRSGNGFVGISAATTDTANTYTAAQTIAPTAATSGVRTALTFTGAADTGRTASTEQSDVYWNLGRTVTWATGALTTQRFIRHGQPTVAFVGASTLTNCAVIYVAGAAVAGTNATITNNYAVWVDDGRCRFDGPVVFNAAQVVQHTSDLTVGPTITTPAMTVRVPSGSTSVTVTHVDVTSTTKFRVTPLTLATNSVYVRACVPGSGSFVLTLSGDPGASHCDLYVELVQPGSGT